MPFRDELARYPSGYADAHLCCRMSQVGIELFSCGAAITDGFPSVSCQRIQRYHSSNRCAKLSVCRRPNDPRASVRTGTCWRRTRASSAGKSAGAQPPTTVAIERTTADAAGRRSAPPNASEQNRRSLGGLTGFNESKFGSNEVITREDRPAVELVSKQGSVAVFSVDLAGDHKDGNIRHRVEAAG